MNFNKIKPYLYALLTTIAFFLDSGKIYKGITVTTNPFLIGVIPLAICFIMILNLYIKYSLKNNRLSLKIYSLLLSFFMVMGNSYLTINSWNLVFGNLLMLLIATLSFIGYYLIFRVITDMIDNFISTKLSKKKDLNTNSKIKAFFDSKTFWHIFWIIIACWVIYIVAFYPIIMSPDPTTQLMQFYNLDNKYADSVILIDQAVKMTNHHPLLYTLLLGGSSLVGNIIGNGNLGLFIYSIVQIIVIAGIYSYTIMYMKKLNSPYWLRAIVLGMYCFVPMYPLFSMAAVKDTLYTGFIILFTILIFDILKFYKNIKVPWSKIIKITITGILICLYRNNGIFIVVFSLPFLMLSNRKNIYRLGIVLVLITSTYLGYKRILLPSLKITEGSIREALSIPFQQTARYVNYHSDELTKDEISTIDKILDYNTLASRYNPIFADPVKDKYNKYTTSKELKEYFDLWVDQLKKHPDVYIQATMNNVYGYFYPNTTRWYLYYSYEGEIKDMGLVNFHFNNLGFIRSGISAYGVAFPFIPVIGLLANIGFNVWCVLFMLVYYIYSKKKKYIITLLPMILSILICIASPVNAYFRYAMPYVFLVPFMWAILIYSINDKKE